MVDAAYVEERIAAWFRKQGFTGRVTEKLTDPLRLKVSQDNYYTAVECITDVGTWGQARLDDLVRVRREGGVNVAESLFDLNGRGLNVLGEDTSTEETTSHTDWVTLLDVQDIYIPGDTPFRLEWKTEIETVGGAGASGKQVRIVFNGTDAIAITLGSTSDLYWVPVMVSSRAPGLSSGNVGRQVFLLTSDPPSITLLTNLGDITSVAIQARTNDTGEGNDIVRSTELVVSL